MFIPVQPTQASPRARELGQELAEVMRRYRDENPATRPVELRQALHVAGGEMRGEMGGMDAQGRKIMALVLLLGAGVFAGVAVYLGGISGSEGDAPPIPWILIATSVLAVVGACSVVLVVKTRR